MILWQKKKQNRLIFLKHLLLWSFTNSKIEPSGMFTLHFYSISITRTFIFILQNSFDAKLFKIIHNHAELERERDRNRMKMRPKQYVNLTLTLHLNSTSITYMLWFWMLMKNFEIWKMKMIESECLIWIRKKTHLF